MLGHPARLLFCSVSSQCMGAGTGTLVKAASSVFMKLRNSVLESVQLFPSFPLYFWKTAIRDSMHRSVSVGLDIFAFEENKKAELITYIAGEWRVLEDHGASFRVEAGS